MAKGSVPKIDLPPAADLFSTQEEREDTSREKIVDVPISEISEFANHPYKVVDDEDMYSLSGSIKEHGVMTPAIIRPKPDGGYEMISGQRRKRGSELAGKETIPCIIRNLTDDEAVIAMVDSNKYREKILPSEKAFAYKMKMDALKHQGRRWESTSCPLGTKLEGARTDKEIAKDSADSARQIQRFICLTKLTKPLLDMVDDGKIALRPAVELSYLTQEEQKLLLDAMVREDCTPSQAQATKMKNFSKEGKLKEEVITSILQERKPNQLEQIKIPTNKLSKYFPKGTSVKSMEDTIIKALDMYQKQLKRKREISR